MSKSKGAESESSDKLIEVMIPILFPLIASGGVGAAVGGAVTAGHAIYGVVIGILGGLVIAKTLFKGHESEGMLWGGIIGGIIAISYSQYSVNEEDVTPEQNLEYGKAFKCVKKEAGKNITNIVSSVTSDPSLSDFVKLALSLPNSFDNITQCMGENPDPSNA